MKYGSSCNKYVYRLIRKFYFLFPDKIYVKIVFRLKNGTRLDLNHPKTFCEKLQWLKLYDRNPLYHTLVDKYRVKEWVKSKIGAGYIIPTFGVWNSPEEIDFAHLPNQFVLKTTQGGGGYGVIVVRDKNKISPSDIVFRLNKSFKQDGSKTNGEWAYYSVPKRIIAEQYIEAPNGGDLTDYKFYCFNGSAQFCQVIANRHSGETIDFFDKQWIHQPFYGLNPVAKPSKNPVAKPSKNPVAKPSNYSEMISISEKLSKGIPFVRVDLYNVNGKIYFGEMTFYPASGYGSFTPEEWNIKIGDLLVLPSK